MFTESVKHAIQAMIYLAVNKDESVMVSKIAEDYDIPRFYLAKIVQTLSKHNLIHSTRGRRGGIKLNKPAKDIRIIDIIHVIEGPPPEHEICLFGLDICSDSVPCPVHDVWKAMKQELNEKLIHQNLETLSKEMHRKHKLLASLNITK
jgi:Rrf2 family protein